MEDSQYSFTLTTLRKANLMLLCYLLYALLLESLFRLNMPSQLLALVKLHWGLKQFAEVKKQTVLFLQTAEVWSTSSATDVCRCGPQTADILPLKKQASPYTFENCILCHLSSFRCFFCST
ncbi:hypothetical protein HanRHA438_Chr09g0407541 [Helianthus annuus]|uniref:Uncharacterized protein n=1 Tax=Helianthus annuus TaxID=4232 RepID=A0A9K3I764_HELAN|nr:hypothetical protein HanXRQr2_Chr09g0395701 [Helianthus annuus]KAJ0526570.1 hypothetical protein HanHA300_Chr09g0324681 [Helianthus annuus]KAJ0542966.1 hypothetical protein HanHA89_Chr09g0345621 [Helianthus annuus]KAJ0708021.1 hypothetical protein HanLR1_Chr09g0324951 [Helianthus annuus]KAJ0711991.1 hypothetical protein HanOQP8_Chr09g0330001 [Helianthus annuus]